MTLASGKPGNIEVQIRADTSHLSPGDKLALPYLVEAVKQVDLVWLKQTANQDFTAERYAVAEKLEAAARFVPHDGFSSFLNNRAEAFRTNSPADWHQSDEEWVGCVGMSLELLLGPIEPSKRLGGKRAFEGTLGIVLPEEQRRVEQYRGWAVEFEAALASQYGYTSRYEDASIITIMDEIIAGGDTLRNFIPMGSIAPYDQDIRIRAGKKTTLIRNIMEAKLKYLTAPIGQRVMGLTALDPSIYLLYVLAHELAHGLNFRFLNDDFGELWYPLEEVKAEVFGILFLYWLAQRGRITRETAEQAAVICGVDSLREIRLEEDAHAVGARIRYNWLLDIGAFSLDGGKIILHREHFFAAFQSLGDELYQLAQTNSPDAAKIFIEKWGDVPDSLRSIVQSLADLPVDIDPVFAEFTG